MHLGTGQREDDKATFARRRQHCIDEFDRCAITPVEIFEHANDGHVLCVRIDEVEPRITNAFGHHRRVLPSRMYVWTIFVRMNSNHFSDERSDPDKIFTGQVRAHERVELGFS